MRMLKSRLMVIWQGFAVTSLIIWIVSVDTLQYNYVAAPMLAVCLSYILYSPNILRVVTTDETQVAAWQPTDELLDFIIENKGFPVVKAKDKFGRTNEKCKEIWTDLENWWIVEKRVNNARLLTDEFLNILHSPESGVAYS